MTFTDSFSSLDFQQDSGELLPGHIVNSTYAIEKIVGAGSMGKVYAARHCELGRRVAIKVIHRSLVENDAAREARLLALIQHPSIISVEHIGQLSDGRTYFVTELLEGASLFARLSQKTINFEEAVHILDKITQGLSAVHSCGITHRDLKPENVFLVYSSRSHPSVKIIDFGLARIENTDSGFVENIQSTVGTPMYMAPEQWRTPNVDFRADIYALGVIAYELLLGSAPFPHAKTPSACCEAHLKEIPLRPRSIKPSISPLLDKLLFSMLAKDPNHRPSLPLVRNVLANLYDTGRDFHAWRFIQRFIQRSALTFALLNTSCKSPPLRAKEHLHAQENDPRLHT